MKPLVMIRILYHSMFSFWSYLIWNTGFEVMGFTPSRIGTVSYTWLEFSDKSSSSSADFHKSASLCEKASFKVWGRVSFEGPVFAKPAKKASLSNNSPMTGFAISGPGVSCSSDSAGGLACAR